jgi:Zn-dependent M28 family amino/carboxypeptidase
MRVNKNSILVFLMVILTGIGVFLVITRQDSETGFNGNRAFNDVDYQVRLGPRIPGSAAHKEFVDWAVKSFSSAGWDVEIQSGEKMGHPIQNIIAHRGKQSTPWVILGAHYDSRMLANKDKNASLRSQPVPGANDGASGVAVLLELARKLPKNLDKNIWLVLFDAEDQGSIPGWNWILGSRYFAEHLEDDPDAVVVIDMIGDASLNIYQERTSTIELTSQIWKEAANLGYSQYFIPQFKFSMLDDHTPFLEKGIPAVDIIDFNYTAWHTTGDTIDKVSPESLKIVGDTLMNWVMAYKP